MKQLPIPTQNIQSFQFNSQEVRTKIIDHEVWFCLVDICKVLLLKDASMTAKRLNPKGTIKTCTLTDGGQQELLFINESNLYKLIFRSNKPEARAFEDWVTGEVLPAIRKTGLYSTQPQLDASSSKEDREPLIKVNTLVKHAPVDYPDVWHMIKAELKTDKAANDFTVGEVHRALAFVQTKIDLYTAKPVYADYPDAQLGFITELALQGARRFSLFISLGDKKTRNTTLITKGFKAGIYLFKEAAIEPKNLNYSIKFVQ